jgi:hypothetical protein
MVISGDYLGTTDLGQYFRRSDLAGAVVIVGFAGQKDTQPILDRYPRLGNKQRTREIFSIVCLQGN